MAKGFKKIERRLEQRRKGFAATQSGKNAKSGGVKQPGSMNGRKAH